MNVFGLVNMRGISSERRRLAFCAQRGRTDWELACRKGTLEQARVGVVV